MPARIRSLDIACAAALGLLALALPTAAHAAQEQRVTSAAGPLLADAVIVVWKPDADRTDRLAARDDAGAGFVRTLGAPRFQLLRPQAGQSVADALAALRADPNVQTAAREHYDVPQATTNDPLFGQQWGLQNVGANVDDFSGALLGADVGALAAWDRTRGTPSTVIADLDTGYRFEHPDLAPVAWTNPADPVNGADDDGNGIVDDAHGADFVGRSANTPATDGDPTDDDLVAGGHGVHTAGTMGAAGNNGVGISGVAQDVRIMPLRVCGPYRDARGDVETVCPTSSQIAAINYAGSHGVRAANMSLGGTTLNPPVRDALAANPGVLFAISAGNDGQDNDPGGVPHYPCAYDPSTTGIAGAIDNVVCVAATNQADGLAGFSDYGATTVDVGAPGTQILSTDPFVVPFADAFAVDDFAASWTATGANGGFARTNEAPLTSFGMSDSPGRAPASLSERESTSVAFHVPPSSGCALLQTRRLVLGVGDVYRYAVQLNGVERTSVRVTTSTSGPGFDRTVLDLPPEFDAGGSVRVEFRFTTGPVPAAGGGAWLDDLELDCVQAVGQANDYAFLDGTSMAAPHVTGAAGLMFSLNPAASVAQVRAALIATVHPLAALTGRTTSGGRIDVAAALDEIRQPGETTIVRRPRRTTTSRRATFAFARSDAALGTAFQCQLDGGAFAPCSSPAAYTVRGGRHAFAVRSSSPHGIVVDPTPATATWTVLQCKVPKLRGKTLRRAKKALRRAHCKLGKVRKPRAGRGGRPPTLVVRSSKPRRGAVRSVGAKVRVTLGAPPRHRRHRR